MYNLTFLFCHYCLDLKQNAKPETNRVQILLYLCLCTHNIHAYLCDRLIIDHIYRKNHFHCSMGNSFMLRLYCFKKKQILQIHKIISKSFLSFLLKDVHMSSEIGEYGRHHKDGVREAFYGSFYTFMFVTMWIGFLFK